MFRTISIFLILLLSLPYFASPSERTEIRHLGIEDGMANNLIRCVYQDKKGFFWFGTKDGLNRYDGYGFKVYRNQINNKFSLINNIVHTISSDENFNLWIGTRQGVSIFNDLSGDFKPAVYQDFKTGKIQIVRKVIREIVAGSGNTMLIGTEGLGLLISKPGTSLTYQIPLQIGAQIFTTYAVQSVKVAANGKVWAFVQNVGLCYLDTKKRKLILASNRILLAFVMEVTNRVVYLGTNNGLYSFKLNAERSADGQLQEDKIFNFSVSSMAVDKNGLLWVGTPGKGLFQFDQVTNELRQFLAKNKESGLNDEQIYSIFIDASSRKWIGTSFGGVTVIDPSPKTFTSWSHQPGINSLPGNAVSAFLEAPTGEIYIGTERSGLSIWNRKLNQFTNFKHSVSENSLGSDFVTSLALGPQGHIWLGTFTDGPCRFDPVSKKFKAYKLIFSNTGIESKVAYSVFCDADQNIWAGTLRRGSLMGGLFVYNKSKDAFDYFDSRLSDLFVIQQLKDKSLWGGNLSQLIKIDQVNKKHEYFDLGHTVRCIFEASNGLLYIGTEGGGLFVFDKKRKKILKRYTTEQGLCNNSVLTILEDANSELWMSTYYGISAFSLKKGTFRNFYQSDGLQSNQFQTNSAIKLRSGEMIFGGIKGFSMFNPNQIVAQHHQPNLLLTEIEINNKNIQEQKKMISAVDNEKILAVKVPYDDAVFSFFFTALEYASPEKILYRYKMEGWDRGWNVSGEERSATYTHISEGTYIFRVQCTNTEGVWGKSEIALKITVLPPWYRTWWAYLAYISITIAIIYLFFHYRISQTRLQYEVKVVQLESQRKNAEYDAEVAKHELERIEHEQERLINDQEKALAEKRMSFFTHISHEFRSPLSLILNPLDELLKKAIDGGSEANELNMIQRNARRMLSLINQLLLFRKADLGFDAIQVSRVDLVSIIQEVYLCFSQQASSKKIDYKFESANSSDDVYADLAKLEIVIFNIISNAVKYTPVNGRILVKLSGDAQKYHIAIEDNGPGIPADAGEKVFERFYQAERTDGTHKSGFGIGLYLAKEFTESHGGRISYVNKPTGGCIFTITLLKGKEHFKGISISEEFENSVKKITSGLEVRAESPVNGKLDVEVWPITDRQSILVIDDDDDVRTYVSSLFLNTYQVYQAEDAERGLTLAKEKLPDLIITDYKMKEIDGIELCRIIKSDPHLSYIPVVMLTASSSSEIKLKSIHGGADDYINKPFERDYLIARVANLLRSRNDLQNYFFNEITLQANNIVVSAEYKAFLDTCIKVVEKHLTDTDFGIQKLAEEVGMSHSNLYKKVKSISGQTVTAFVRYIRLSKAAELMINSDFNVSEVAFRSGFNDSKYFGKQFYKLFKINPSDFIKRHRKSFNKQYRKK